MSDYDLSDEGVRAMVRRRAVAQAEFKNADLTLDYTRQILFWRKIAIEVGPHAQGPRPLPPLRYVVVESEETGNLAQAIQSPVERLDAIEDPPPAPEPPGGIVRIGPEISPDRFPGWRFVLLGDTVLPGQRILHQGRGYEKRVASEGPFGTSYAYVPV